MKAVTHPKAPILVTGMHRAGTTWVGRMLGASGQTVYIHEPLNPLHAPGIFGRRIDRFYHLVTPQNEHELLPAYADTLAYRYRLRQQLRVTRSAEAAWGAAKDLSRFTRGRLLQLRPLLKDPFAVFSIPWFVRRLGADVVVVMRHPLANVSSLKRLGWTFDPGEILLQDVPQGDRLAEYRRASRELPSDDIIGQGALLWSAIASLVLEDSRELRSLRVVRHEALAGDALGEFSTLYEELGLTLNHKAMRRIARASSDSNPREARIEKFRRTSLNSRASLGNWAPRLTRDEVDRIYKLTRSQLDAFYPPDDWVERLFRVHRSAPA
jgi:Sulfotransferase family